MDITYQKITGRTEVIAVNFEKLTSTLKSERVLVTGAGGSIGSQITKLLATHGVGEYFALDRDENSLHRLQLDLGSSALFDNHRYILCDIRNKQAVSDVIKNFSPTIVIHAAALKHLSALERYAGEGFQTNIVGTFNVLDESAKLGVKKFINISTDKAAAPVSVLGKSKRISELMTMHFSKSDEFKIEAHSVRFGNVFASRGSVIETFIHQILNEQAITLTDSRVARYFMSIFEASMLVLETISYPSKGGIYLLEMGEPIELKEIALNLMKALNKEVPIEITGLRPGEKLFEDLTAPDEKSIKTDSSQISHIEETIEKAYSSNEIENALNINFSDLNFENLIKYLET